MLAALAFIPSPSRNVVELGPLTIRLYGLMLLLGIVAAIWLSGRRWVSWGGDWDLIFSCAMWGVAAGIVGARIYHVVTSWNEVPDEWWGVFAVWKGGLGVWGGVACGVLAGVTVAKRRGANIPLLMDAVGPAILLAQAIGRLGNYFNQELYGKPSDLPWALEIDPQHREPGYENVATFHPTFLYEIIWDGIGIAVLLWLGRRLRPGGVFWLYVAWYSLGRATWEEHLRIDPSHYIAGMRLNGWISIGVFLAAMAAFVWTQRRPARSRDAGVRATG